MKIYLVALEVQSSLHSLTCILIWYVSTHHIFYQHKYFFLYFFCSSLFLDAAIVHALREILQSAGNHRIPWKRGKERRREEGRWKRVKREEKKATYIYVLLKPLRLLLDRHIIRDLVGYILRALKHKRLSTSMKSQTHKGGGRRGKGGGGRGKRKESLRQEVHSFSYWLIFNTVQHRRSVRIIKQLSTLVSNCCTRVSVASFFLSFFLFFSPFFHDNKTSKQKAGSMTMPEEDLEALYNPDIHFKSWRQGIPSTIPIALHLSWENPGIFISSPLLSSPLLSLSLRFFQLSTFLFINFL